MLTSSARKSLLDGVNVLVYRRNVNATAVESAGTRETKYNAR